MFADPKKVGARRLRRRLKAGASIALALVAGAFLACKGGSDAPGPAPSGPDARTGPGPKAAGDAGATEVDAGATEAAASGPDAGTADAAAEAADGGPSDAGTALVVRDGGADAGTRAPRVDKREHRKGMPVRDNLLE